MTDNTAPKTETQHPGWLGFALDFGPLLIFFLTFKFMGRSDNVVDAVKSVMVGTGAFMVAIIAAVAISAWKFKRVSPMLWLSAILVLGFGGLTIYYGDQSFIQHKPTAIYALFAAVLFIGLWRGHALLKSLLQVAYEGLSDEGWRKLSRNWAWFFVFMAGLNEVLVRTFSFDTWLTLKVWGVTALSFIFALANVPMMLKHGLKVLDTDEETPPPVS